MLLQSIPQALKQFMWQHHRGSLLTEWEIPYNELQLKRLIAKGKMGDVYQYVLMQLSIFAHLLYSCV